MIGKRRDYAAGTPNGSSLLDTDAVFCACVFELAGVEDDDAEADADANTKVDSSTRPAPTSDDARVNDDLEAQMASQTTVDEVQIFHCVSHPFRPREVQASIHAVEEQEQGPIAAAQMSTLPVGVAAGIAYRVSRVRIAAFMCIVIIIIIF